MSSRKKSSSSKKPSAKKAVVVIDEPVAGFVVDSDEDLDYPEPTLVMDTSDRPEKSALASKSSKKKTSKKSSKKVKIGEPRVREYVKGSSSQEMGDSDFYNSPEERRAREKRFRKRERQARREARALEESDKVAISEPTPTPIPFFESSAEPTRADSQQIIRDNEALLNLVKAKMSRTVPSTTIDPNRPGAYDSRRRDGRLGGLLARDVANIKFEYPDFIDPSMAKSIDRLLASAGSGGTEVELSFGVFELGSSAEPKFYPGLASVNQFNDLVRNLQGLVASGTVKSSVETDVVEIEENSVTATDRVAIRKITKLIDGGCSTDPDSVPNSEKQITWEEKSRSQGTSISNQMWGYRISTSKEVKLARAPKSFNPTIRRNRTRTSFVTSRNSPYPGFVVDCTQVRTTVAGSQNTMSASRFEVEIEVKDAKKASVAGLGALVGDLLRFMQTPSLPIPEFVPTPFEYGPDGDFGDEAAIQYEKEETEFLKIHAERAAKHSLATLKIPKENLMTLKEREFATLMHNNLFSRSFASAKPFILAKDYTNKPINLRLEDLLVPGVSDRYALTVKLNGVRSMLLMADTGIYAYRPPFEVSKRSSVGSNEFSGTLLDCEEYYMPSTDGRDGTITYYAFDILFFKGEDIRTQSLAERLAKLKIAVGAFSLGRATSDLKYAITPKTFFVDPKKNVYERVADAVQEYNILYDKGFSLDGLIFQHHGDYVNPYTKKWKPKEEMAIDVLLRRLEDGYVDEFEMLVGGFSPVRGAGRVEDVVFTGTPRNPAPSTIIVPGGMIDGLCADGLVVEVKFDSEAGALREGNPPGAWKIFRHRPDRDRPNRLDVAKEVWRDIVSPVSINDVKGKTLKLMRIFHNRFKASLISREFTSGQTVLDLGFGRGGDFAKYEAAGVSKIWAVEPNASNLEEAKRRIKERNAEVEVWNARNKSRKPITLPRVTFIRDEGVLVGAENTDVIMEQIGEKSVDGAVAMFSLTFLYENEEKIDGFVETVDRAIPRGGKFVGMVMDGDRVKSLLNVSGAPPAKISKKKADALRELENSSRGAENLSTDSFGLKTYDVPPFKIQQLSGFGDHNDPEDLPIYTGDALEVLIREQDSMVFVPGSEEEAREGQKEWLVFFEDLKARFAKKGIYLARNDKGFRTGFLDKGATFELLPRDAQTFSKLNRYFVFERPARTTRKMENLDPEPGKIAPFYLKGYEGDDLYIFGVDRGIDSFLHAVFWALSADYRAETSAEDKETFVRRARNRMARSLEFDKFLGLGRGAVADRFTRLAYPKTGFIPLASAQRLGMNLFVETLRNPSAFLGKDMILDLASEVFDANIFVLSGTGEVVKGTNADRYVAKRPTAVLVTRDAGGTFSPLARSLSGGAVESIGADARATRNVIVVEAVLRQISDRPFGETDDQEPLIADSDSD